MAEGKGKAQAVVQHSRMKGVRGHGTTVGMKVWDVGHTTGFSLLRSIGSSAYVPQAGKLH
jgi:hypothetical protein